MKIRCHLAGRRGRRTITEMARASGVQRAYLSQIEAGRRLPTDDELRRISEAYGMTLGQIYDFEPPQYVLIEIDPKEDNNA